MGWQKKAKETKFTTLVQVNVVERCYLTLEKLYFIVMGRSELTGFSTPLVRCKPLIPSVPSFSLANLLTCSAVCFQFPLWFSGNHTRRRSFLLERPSNRALIEWESCPTSSHMPSIYSGLLRSSSAYTLCKLTVFRSAALLALSLQTYFFIFGILSL